MNYWDSKTWEPPIQLKAYDTLITFILDGGDFDIPPSNKQFISIDTLYVRLSEAPTTECRIRSEDRLMVVSGDVSR